MEQGRNTYWGEEMGLQEKEDDLVWAKRKAQKKKIKGWESEKNKFEYLETISWRWKLDCYSMSQIFSSIENCQALVALFSITELVQFYLVSGSDVVAS